MASFTMLVKFGSWRISCPVKILVCMYICMYIYFVLLVAANDKACVLNELGRMFLTFSDRSSACRYFRQAALTAQPDEQNCHNLREWNVRMKFFFIILELT